MLSFILVYFFLAKVSTNSKVKTNRRIRTKNMQCHSPSYNQLFQVTPLGDQRIKALQVRNVEVGPVERSAPAIHEWLVTDYVSDLTGTCHNSEHYLRKGVTRA